MVDVLQTFIKTAAVSGIAFFWVNFTVVAFKFAWHIVSTSPETRDPVLKEKVMCESCHGYFLDDGGELKHGKLLCVFCSDDLVRDKLELDKKKFNIYQTCLTKLFKQY